MLKAKADAPAIASTAILSPEPVGPASLAAPKVGNEFSMAGSMGWKPMPVDATVPPEVPIESWPPLYGELPAQKKASQRRPSTKRTATVPKVLR